MSHQVAIVGAGAAGAAAATAIDDAATVTVFEREATVGGRSRTRQHGDCRYEIGANYLTPTSDAVQSVLATAVPDDALLDLDGEIRPFDGDGTVDDGDATGGHESTGDGEATGGDGHDGDRRVTCKEGLATIPDHILAETDADVVCDTRMDALERTDGRWRLHDGEGDDRGVFDAVVLTPPAPLTADVLGRSEWSHPDCRTVREAIESVPYRPIASVACHYPFELDRPWYALVNEDREHPIGWIAREDRKPGYVPEGESVLLVQCSSDFTVEHYGDDPADLVDRVTTLAAGLLDEERLTDPDWYDVHCWRYAVPEAGVDSQALACTADHDLYVAGDWVVGDDRLNGALRSGLATGEEIRETLR